MIEKQFGTEYGPALQRGDKTACIVSLQAEIDRLGGVPYGWMRIYETLLFGFYNPRTGQCFPSHKAIAIKARCGVRTVQRALKWAREHNLIQWAHGLVRDGWRVLRTSNRYAFAAFLTMRRVIASIAVSNGQRRRGVFLASCQARNSAEVGRYRELNSAPSAEVCGDQPSGDGCGARILDTTTGIVFEKGPQGWFEFDPHTGKKDVHLDHFNP